MLPERPGNHFIYKEWTVSDEYPELARQIELTELDKMKIYYQTNVLESVRGKCNNLPTRVLSGKRSTELNSAPLIKGAEDSDHLYTNEKCATDFCFYWDNFFLWNAYYYMPKLVPIGFGQVIIYLNSENFGIPRFIHFSLITRKHQGERLITIDSVYHTIETAIEQYPELSRYIRQPLTDKIA